MGLPSPSQEQPRGRGVSAGCLRAGGPRSQGWNWILRRAEQGAGRTGLPLEASIRGRLWRKRGPHAGPAGQHQRSRVRLGLGSRRAVATKKQAQSPTGLSSAPAGPGTMSPRGRSVREAARDRACSAPTERVREPFSLVPVGFSGSPLLPHARGRPEPSPAVQPGPCSFAGSSR